MRALQHQYEMNPWYQSVTLALYMWNAQGFSSLLLSSRPATSVSSPCRPQRMSNKYELFPTKIIITLERQINFLRSSFTFIVIILFYFVFRNIQEIHTWRWYGMVCCMRVQWKPIDRPSLFGFGWNISRLMVACFSFFGFRGLICCLWLLDIDFGMMNCHDLLLKCFGGSLSANTYQFQAL